MPDDEKKNRIYISREQMIWLPPAERELVEKGEHPNLFTREATVSHSAARILRGEKAFSARNKFENRQPWDSSLAKRVRPKPKKRPILRPDLAAVWHKPYPNYGRWRD